MISGEDGSGSDDFSGPKIVKEALPREDDDPILGCSFMTVTTDHSKIFNQSLFYWRSFSSSQLLSFHTHVVRDAEAREWDRMWKIVRA